MSEVEETLKRINSHKGVQGIVIVNQDCIPIRSTLDEKMSKALATDITQLCGRARSAVRSLDPQNDLTFLRIRSKKYEILVAPDKVRAVAEHSSSSSPLCLCSSRSPSATAAAAAAVATLGPLRMLRAWLPLGRPCRCSRHHRAQSSLSLALRARVLSMFCAFSLASGFHVGGGAEPECRGVSGWVSRVERELLGSGLERALMRAWPLGLRARRVCAAKCSRETH